MFFPHPPDPPPVQTGSRAHRPPTQSVPKALSPKVKLLGAEVEHSLSSSADVRNAVAMAPLPRHLHGVLLI